MLAAPSGVPRLAARVFLGVVERIRLQREGFRGQIRRVRVACVGSSGYRPGQGKYCATAPFEPDPSPPRLTL